MKSSHVTLTAATVSTVTLTEAAGGTTLKHVAVFVPNADAVVYFTINGADPTVAGADTYVVGPGMASLAVPIGSTNSVVVKLISAGAPVIGVVAE